MAPQADSNRVQVRFSPETVWGETPATPVMQELRITGESLSHQKQTIQSETLRIDRMREASVEVASSAGGDIEMEVAYSKTEIGALMEGALATTFETISLTGLTITVVAAARTMTRASGSWISDQIKPGMWIRTKSFAAAGNNGVFKVASLTATVLTLDTLTTSGLVDVTSAAGIAVIANMLRNGGTAKSYLIEKQFGGLAAGAFVYMNGMRVGSMALSVASQQIAQATFSFEGKEGKTATTTRAGSSTVPGSSVSLNGTVNVGSLYEGAAALATGIRSVSVNVGNNLRQLPKIGQKAAAGVAMGFCDVSGSIEAYFEDLTLLDKFINHTSSALQFRLNDDPTGSALGNIIIVTVPSLRYSGDATPKTPGGNQDVMIPLEFTANRFIDVDGSAYQIQIDLLPIF